MLDIASNSMYLRYLSPPDRLPAPGGPHHQVNLTIETRYKLYAFCDDLKPAITSIWEFRLVERVMTLFERSSGCKMYRTAISQKCNFLPLGKWKTNLKQNMIPHDFFILSDHLDFLGVILKSTYSLTRKANGDLLQDKIKKVIGPWRAGRFMSLNLRPHSINLYATASSCIDATLWITG